MRLTKVVEFFNDEEQMLLWSVMPMVYILTLTIPFFLASLPIKIVIFLVQIFLFAFQIFCFFRHKKIFKKKEL